MGNILKFSKYISIITLLGFIGNITYLFLYEFALTEESCLEIGDCLTEKSAYCTNFKRVRCQPSLWGGVSYFFLFWTSCYFIYILYHFDKPTPLIQAESVEIPNANFNSNSNTAP